MSDNVNGPRPLFDMAAISRLGVELQKKSLEISQANTESTLEYMRVLLASRTPGDVMQATQDFTSRQLEAFQRQAKELVDLASNKKDAW